jgi:hypothetical protein
MRFFSGLITALIIAIIIAAFTAPGDERFKEFINKRNNDSTTTAIIGNSKPVKFFSVRLFSFHYVNYFEKTESPKPEAGLGRRRMFKKLGTLNQTGSERYLGLFGKFWKLKQ